MESNAAAAAPPYSEHGPDILQRLRQLQGFKTQWATTEECQRFGTPGFRVDAVRLSNRPTRLTTPRPYLAPQTGAWRKVFILGPEGDLAVRPWEKWTASTERAWRRR